MKKVILSTPLLLEEGLFDCKKITLGEAIDWLDQRVENYCGHESVKILGLSPDKSRRECIGYDMALVIKPRARLEFGREYTVEEIEKIGVDFVMITKCPF